MVPDIFCLFKILLELALFLMPYWKARVMRSYDSSMGRVEANFSGRESVDCEDSEV